MTKSLQQRTRPGTLLGRLIESPDLVRTVRGLSASAFSAVVKHVGVEDAGELLALCTTEQLVSAFDEDLFVNARPGQREEFDPERFAVWLEVLLEAGDDVAANRVAELSQDFVIHAVSSLVLVLDYDALMTRMAEGGEDARQADKALESALCEELDGYMLVARQHAGWDAVLALILALDRLHRPFLVRILDRSAEISRKYVDDMEALYTVLSEEASLAEDVEAEREERRAKQGHVEPRAARSFLALARTAPDPGAPRDPVTRAYFRDLGPAGRTAPAGGARTDSLASVLVELGPAQAAELAALPAATTDAAALMREELPLLEALRLLQDQAPARFDERMAELAYLANVLLAGAEQDGGRYRPDHAADAVIATVAFGAELEARGRRQGAARRHARATAHELVTVLEACAADVLFRRGSSTLSQGQTRHARAGLLRSRVELEEALTALPG